MIKTLTVTLILCFLSFLATTQNCPDDINNSPGNSNNTANAIVYDSNGDVLQTITCDATGNSGQVDCSLDDYNFPPGSYITIEFSNGPNTTTCFYDTDGELIEDFISLPVDFGGLTVESNGIKNELSWVTFTERNNSFFKLEYSSNGKDWEEIEIIEGAGNSTAQIDYATTHSNFKSGINYYRISQQDIDGELQFLAIASIDNRAALELQVKAGEMKIYSNKEIKSIKCYAMNGKVVSREMISQNKYQANINLSRHSNGILLVNIIFSDGSSEQKKVFLGQ
jgi:hypothetical protein